MRDYAAVLHTDIIQKNRYVLGGNTTGALTAREQKIIYAVVSRIKPDDTTLEPQDFGIKEFCALCGITNKGGRPMKDIIEVISKLASRVIWLYESPTDGGEEKITVLHWLSKAYILPGNRHTVRLLLDEELSPFLIGLRKNYTKVYIHDILRMKSHYSILLYQILSSYEYMGRPIAFDLQDLQERLNCVRPSYTKNFSAFARRVLTPALDEINKYSSIEVTMKKKTIGKKQVVGVVFYIRKLRDSQIEEDQKEFNARYARVEDELSEESYDFFNDDSAVYDASANIVIERDQTETEIPPLFQKEEVEEPAV